MSRVSTSSLPPVDVVATKRISRFGLSSAYARASFNRKTACANIAIAMIIAPLHGACPAALRI